MKKVSSSDQVMISIVVPVYNTLPFLKECIQSVLAQTFSNFELILINDGSTDGSEKICERMREKDHRIRFISIADNQGVSHARNVGMDASRGKYLFFLDSDDLLHPRLLEELYLQAESTESELVMTEFVNRNHKNSRNIEKFIKGDFEPEWTRMMDEEVLEQWFTLDMIKYVVWGKLFLRKSLGNLRFAEDLIIAEDYLFDYMFLLKKPHSVMYSKTPGYYYRYRKNSAYNDMTMEGCLTDQRITKFIRNQELLAGRKKNAIQIEEVYLSKLYDASFLIKDKNRPERKKIKKLVMTEKQGPLFCGISPLCKILLYVYLYVPFLYRLLRKIKGIVGTLGG